MFLVGCYINGVLVAQARAQTFADGAMGAALRAQEALHFDDQLEPTLLGAEGAEAGAQPQPEQQAAGLPET